MPDALTNDMKVAFQSGSSRAQTHELKRIGSYARTLHGSPLATEYLWICTCGGEGKWTFDEDAARKGFDRHVSRASDKAETPDG